MKKNSSFVTFKKKAKAKNLEKLNEKVFATSKYGTI